MNHFFKHLRLRNERQYNVIQPRELSKARSKSAEKSISEALKNNKHVMPTPDIEVVDMSRNMRVVEQTAKYY